MRGNPQALFGKRPTEKDPAKGTSPAVDFTRREATRKRPGFRSLNPGPRRAAHPVTSSPGAGLAEIACDTEASIYGQQN